MLKHVLLIAILIVQVAFAQQKIAILNTEDDGEPPIKFSELNVLTAKLRDIARKILLSNNYEIMTEQTILSFLGSQEEMAKVCEAADGCLAKIGRDIDADYVGQARLNRFGKFLAIKMEVYNVKNGTLVGSFTDESSKDIYELLATIEKKSPSMFKEMVDIVPVLPVATKVLYSKETSYPTTDYNMDIKKSNSRNNWLSAEAAITFGFGARYEHMLNSSISLGTKIHINPIIYEDEDEDDDGYATTKGTSFIIDALFHFYPNEGTFYLSASIGWAIYKFYDTEEISFGPVITPGIGWKWDVFDVGGLFLQLGVSLPIFLGTDAPSSDIILPYLGIGWAY